MTTTAQATTTATTARVTATAERVAKQAQQARLVATKAVHRRRPARKVGAAAEAVAVLGKVAAALLLLAHKAGVVARVRVGVAAHRGDDELVVHPCQVVGRQRLVDLLAENVVALRAQQLLEEGDRVRRVPAAAVAVTQVAVRATQHRLAKQRRVVAEEQTAQVTHRALAPRAQLQQGKADAQRTARSRLRQLVGRLAHVLDTLAHALVAQAHEDDAVDRHTRRQRQLGRQHANEVRRRRRQHVDQARRQDGNEYVHPVERRNEGLQRHDNVRHHGKVRPDDDDVLLEQQVREHAEQLARVPRKHVEHRQRRRVNERAQAVVWPVQGDAQVERRQELGPARRRRGARECADEAAAVCLAVAAVQVGEAVEEVAPRVRRYRHHRLAADEGGDVAILAHAVAVGEDECVRKAVRRVRRARVGEREAR